MWSKKQWRKAGRSGARAARAGGTLSAFSSRSGFGVTIKGPDPGPGASPAKKAKMLSLGAEFGSKAYPQFNKFSPPVWRANWPVRGGYGVHQALRLYGDDILAAYLQNILNAARRAGMDTDRIMRRARIPGLAA